MEKNKKAVSYTQKVDKTMYYYRGTSLVERLFDIRCSDFGYQTWDQQVEHHTFSSDVYVYNLLCLAWDSDTPKEAERLAYPNWLWYDPEPPSPSPCGVVKVARTGDLLPGHYPGEASAAGHLSAFQRIDDTLREASKLIEILRNFTGLFPSGSLED